MTELEAKRCGSLANAFDCGTGHHTLHSRYIGLAREKGFRVRRPVQKDCGQVGPAQGTPG